ncbi:MAG: pyruvate ferredoxin oxidoreductase subunit gamma [Candidatus Hadarchaeales archaeon]
MIEVTFHGRGGQGAVTAARLLAEAAFLEGKFCQAFPTFGAERRGAPVCAFARISENPIRLRSQVYSPDHVVVLDASLLGVVDVCEGLKENGWIVINSKGLPGKLAGKNVAIVDATKIAIEAIGRPIVNTAMLGAFAKITNVVSLDSLIKVVNKYFEGKGAVGNMNALRIAYEEVKVV